MRRSWRFGQKDRVRIDTIASEGEAGVQANLQRKADAADHMFQNLVDLMKDSLRIDRSNPFDKRAEVPPWLMSGESGISSADGAGPNGSLKPQRARARGTAKT
jgi:hypothetical protein